MMVGKALKAYNKNRSRGNNNQNNNDLDNMVVHRKGYNLADLNKDLSMI